MASLYQALRLIKTNHYHHLNPHEKHFINSMRDGLGGLDEVKDRDISDYLTPKQEKFIWWIAKRFNIYIQKQVFQVRPEKPNLPLVHARFAVEPEPSFKEPLIRRQDTKFSISTGLGNEFDMLATIDRLAAYKPKPPYDQKFMNRPLLVIYCIVSKAGWPLGKLFLEMVSYASKDPDERSKISAFLAAMNKLDLETEPEPPKIKKPRRPSRKLHLVCYK